jgi:hypothetical protein
MKPPLNEFEAALFFDAQLLPAILRLNKTSFHSVQICIRYSETVVGQQNVTS